ncbi:MAG: hypothetical protein P1U34_08625 [Coxiellaceae bacterium]|nr:hypothetical protein [Coxiellaceae bacterium]
MRYAENGLAVFTLIAKPILNGGQAKYLSEKYSQCWWQLPDSIGREAYVWSAAILCGGFILAARGPAIWRHRHRQRKQQKVSQDGSYPLNFGLLLAAISASLSGWLGARSFYASQSWWAIVSLSFATANVVSFSQFNRRKAQKNYQHMRRILCGDQAINKKALVWTALLGVLGSVQHAFYSFSTNRAALQTAEEYFIGQPCELQHSLNMAASSILSIAILFTNLLTRSYACYHWFDRRWPLDEQSQYVELESGIADKAETPIAHWRYGVVLPFAVLACIETINTWFGYSETFVDSFNPDACEAHWPYRIAGTLLSVFATFGHAVFTVSMANEELGLNLGF